MSEPTSRTWIRCGEPGSTEPMHGLGDLVVAMGGDETSFIGEVLKLVSKAQNNPENVAALRRGWPHLVRAWELWMAMRPTPTCDQLHTALADDPEASVVYAASDVKPTLRAAGAAAAAALAQDGIPPSHSVRYASLALAAAVPVLAGGFAANASAAFESAASLAADRIVDAEEENRQLRAALAATAGSSDPNVHWCAALRCARPATVGSKYCCRPCADAWEANPRFALHAHSDRCDDLTAARGTKNITPAGV